jgi:hypothetical protein
LLTFTFLSIIYIPDLLTVHGSSFIHTPLASMAARPFGRLKNTAAIVFFPGLKIYFENLDAAGIK